MFKEIEGLKDGVIGFHVGGVVGKEEYVDKFIPTMEKALQKHDKISAIIVIDDDFDHYTWQAVLEDTKVGFKHPLEWEKIAIVTDVEWMVDVLKYLRLLAPYKVQVFSHDALEEAMKWVQAQERHLEVTLDEAKQILVLEPHGTLTKDDFKYLASIVDPYLAKEGELKGLMIRTKNFPGWDSFAAMREHVAFVKKHHKKIDKLALVTDSSLVEVFQTIAGDFVHPNIKEFNYDEVADAFAWLEA